jgi:soluble lytic murein transglycosylase-like protein
VASRSDTIPGVRSSLFLASVAVLVLVGGSASAQVSLVVRNGKKIIYNVPSGSSRSGDLTWLARQRDRSTIYDAIINRHCDRLGVDPVLAKAVIQVESGYDPHCISRKGARGLMQLMPETARRFGVSRIFDPEQNIRGGVTYLAVLLQMFSNDLPKTLAAYNAGENAVVRYSGIPPYSETVTYVARALTVYYGRPYGEATGFAGHGGAKLKGGFGASARDPLALLAAAAEATPHVLPALRYLGTN